MARLLLVKETLGTLRRESLYTIGRLRVDPQALPLLGLTDAWLPRIKAASERLLELEQEQIFADAARVGADFTLDRVARDFGRDLKSAVKEDYQSLRWLRYWKVAPSVFVKGALQVAVNTMRGWLKDPDPVLVPLIPRLEAAIARVDATVQRDAEITTERGQVWLVRSELVTFLNHSREELESELQAIARREDLDRAWVASFFRTTKAPKEDEEGEVGGEAPAEPTVG